MSDKSEQRLKLEAMAKEMDLSFPANIGDEKLQNRIDAAKAETKKMQALIAAAEAEQGGPVQDTSDGIAPAVESQHSVSPPKASEKMLRVAGPKKGRWRAGMHFTMEPRDLRASDLTPKQIEMIEADKSLNVVTYEAPVSAK
ncbi:MAG: hypothetical protein N4A53_08105 [Pelagimonas sp.]|jgi:hypothetical protein|nr:hypothetical protein [Pelagimonas sp.]